MLGRQGDSLVQNDIGVHALILNIRINVRNGSTAAFNPFDQLGYFAWNVVRNWTVLFATRSVTIAVTI